MSLLMENRSRFLSTRGDKTQTCFCICSLFKVCCQSVCLCVFLSFRDEFTEDDTDERDRTMCGSAAEVTVPETSPGNDRKSM